MQRNYRRGAHAAGGPELVGQTVGQVLSRTLQRLHLPIGTRTIAPGLSAAMPSSRAGRNTTGGAIAAMFRQRRSFNSRSQATFPEANAYIGAKVASGTKQASLAAEVNTYARRVVHGEGRHLFSDIAG